MFKATAPAAEKLFSLLDLLTPHELLRHAPRCVEEHVVDVLHAQDGEQALLEVEQREHAPLELADLLVAVQAKQQVSAVFARLLQEPRVPSVEEVEAAVDVSVPTTRSPRKSILSQDLLCGLLPSGNQMAGS